jgi:hypothetical protein
VAPGRPASELDLLQETIEQLSNVSSALEHIYQGQIRQTDVFEQILDAIKAT